MKRISLSLICLLMILPLIYFAVGRFKPAPQPDIFIYLIDALRADHLGCYGYDRPTSPVIDAFAEEAVLFEQAQTTAPFTRPAITSLFSGSQQIAHRIMQNRNPLSDDILFISEILRDAGYQTHAFSTNPQITSTRGFDQGFCTFHFENDGRVTSVNSWIHNILQNTPKDSPLFLYCHTLEPHAPYTPNKKTLKSFDSGFQGSLTGEWPALKRVRWYEAYKSETDIDHLVDLYDAEIFDSDTGFGEFLRLLRKADRYENALIILLADHGEAFNEHGNILHGWSLNKELLHIPVIIRFPRGRFAGKRVSRLASILDIFPTILSQIDSSHSSDHELTGIDLIRLIVEPVKIPPRRLYASLSQRKDTRELQLISVLNESGYKRILHIPQENQPPPPSGLTGLFDISTDPSEQIDLSTSETIVCAREDARLLAWHSAQKAFRSNSQTNHIPLSEQERQDLQALGYLR